MLRILLIDDETSARDDLRNLLGAHPDVGIVGEAAVFDSARDRLRRGGYELVFLDVQLLGGSGFDLVPDVAPGARIIFVTAFDKFAMRAFEVNALDYLQKPVRVARLAETLRRASEAIASTPAPDDAGSTRPVLPDDLVQVKTGPGHSRFIRVADIVAIASQENYSELRLAGGEHLLVRQTLAAWEQRLPASHFFRVHRQSIANLARILRVQNLDEEVALLHLDGLAEPVRARRDRWSELRARLAALGMHA